MIVLSFSDLWCAIKRTKRLLILSASICGVLVFGYSLLHPPTFTAEGIFKGASQPTVTTFTKALELFGGSESYATVDDPKVFLHSYPVLEDVVHTLHLQADIRERKNTNLLKQIGHTLQAEKVQRILKHKRPRSSILKVPVAAKVILPDQEEPLYFLQFDYPGEVSCHFTLTFLDARHFRVEHKKKILGEGTLGQPFQWAGGTFTLEAASSLLGKTYDLTFIPLEAAVKSVAESLQVKRCKEHSSLVSVAFTHTNRLLATSIVNCTMDCFQHYLTEIGKQKIAKQLHYLQQRQQEALVGLETVMEEHKAYLESHLDAGEMLLLENELRYMAEKQTEERRRLSATALEMTQIHQALTGKTPSSFSDFMHTLFLERPEHPSDLTLEGARALIQEHQRSLDLIGIELEQYDDCLEKLSTPHFDASAFSKILDDPTLRTRFDYIHTLDRNLIDNKNWSEKERVQLQEELTTEKQFLAKHIHDLKRGAFLKSEVLCNRLKSLHTSLLHLLADHYANTEKNLHALTQNAAHFPQKWLTEQKIELNTKLRIEMIESITKMIEAKNIGYHLDYLNAAPLKNAFAPLIPNSPLLFLSFLSGGLMGAGMGLLALLLKELWLGPTASYTNLKSEGKTVATYAHTIDDLKKIHYRLQKNGTILALITHNASFVHNLCSLFTKAGENILLINLNNQSSQETMTERDYGYELTLQETCLLNHQYLKNQQIQFARLILYVDPKLSLETEIATDLAEYTLFSLRDTTRWRDLPKLPENTLFIVEALQKNTLSQTALFLEELIPTELSHQER